MTAYRNDFDETKIYVFFIKDNDLFKKNNEILEKVNNIIYKELDSNPVFNEKHVKIKTKSYNRKINKNLNDNKIPKEVSQVIFCGCF